MTNATVNHITIAPTLTPHGQLILARAADAPALSAELACRLELAFARGPGHGLLQLGAAEVSTLLPPTLVYWREFAARYVTIVCSLPGVDAQRSLATIPALPLAELDTLALFAPPMTGAEYLTSTVLAALWTELDRAFREELIVSKASVQEFLRAKHPAWNLVGRVHFNLAEHRSDPEMPFAFLATYTARLSDGANAQHLPLGHALAEYAGAANQPRLLSLLLPVQRAAEACGWLKEMVDAGDIFHPLRWTPAEAYQMLNDLPRLEAAGVIVRVPGTWRSRRPPRPQVTATVGGKAPSGIGSAALLDFKMHVVLDGETLNDAELRELLGGTDGLRLLRGKWIEVDREKLNRMLDEFRLVERAAKTTGLSFAEAARLVSGAGSPGETFGDAVSPEWSQVVAGPWLSKTLEALRHPDALPVLDPGAALHATLRPYQQTGVRWLHLLSSLGLGACLADDMGLGKTMQVLALLLVHRKQKRRAHLPSVLVAPASLLANWENEITRFAPTLRTLIAHPSAMSSGDLRDLSATTLTDIDLVITSYGSLARIPGLIGTSWQLAILDEAQAIKNPGARQTRTAKQLKANSRIALTGTPVENRLGDLWSIFDFLNPGLLGNSKEFTRFAKGLASRAHNPYGPLRELVRPYILRRLKSDKRVISDLPEKTEVTAFCGLSKKQAALYQGAVKELAHQLEQAEGISRRGTVLAFLMRFKQICNHPSQALSDGAWREGDSGKLARLREIAEVIAAKQEKMLVFTQFREATAPLATFLASVFGREGLVLHGGTPVRTRQSLVKRFQEDEQIPFFVISLKAGGSGLNLTAASHVVHFDRWWNPAVENQATDRAFRIGQRKNVLVHKFVCRGTVEERIDELIESKRALSENLLEGDGRAELLVTEMGSDELLKLVALNIHTALEE